MTNARFYSFTGFISGGRQDINALDWPYISRECIATSDEAAVNTGRDLTPRGVNVLLVQLDQPARIEVCPANGDRIADIDSPEFPAGSHVPGGEKTSQWSGGIVPLRGGVITSHWLG